VTDCTCCACHGCKTTDANKCSACEGLGTGHTPTKYHLTLKSGTTGSPLCTYDLASPFHVYQVKVTNAVLSGAYSVQVDQDATDKCRWSKDVSADKPVDIKYCVGDGSGCAACTPSISISNSVILTCAHGFCAEPHFLITTSDPFFTGGGPDFTIDVPFWSFDTTNCGDCCEDEDRDGSASSGSEDWFTLVSGGYFLTPC